MIPPGKPKLTDRLASFTTYVRSVVGSRVVPSNDMNTMTRSTGEHTAVFVPQSNLEKTTLYTGLQANPAWYADRAPAAPFPPTAKSYQFGDDVLLADRFDDGLYHHWLHRRANPEGFPLIAPTNDASVVRDLQKLRLAASYKAAEGSFGL